MHDLVKKKASTVAEKCGAIAYADYRKMLDSEKLDAVEVCVPPFAHIDQEILVAERGIHLFMEKPVNLSLERAKKVNKVIKQTGIISAVGYQYRYYDITEKMKQFLQHNRPGIFIGYWLEKMPEAPWWRVKEKSGGQVVEMSTHLFDLARYLFGEVEKVFAGSTKGLMEDTENYNLEDTSTVTLCFKSGFSGTIFSACFLKTDFVRVSLEIFCSKVILEYDAVSAKIRVTGQGGVEEIKVTNDPYLLEDKTFIEAIKKGDSSLIRSSYNDALKTLNLTLGANRSMKTEEVVKL